MWRRRLAELSLLTSEAVVLLMVGGVLAAGADGDGPSFIAVSAATLGGFYLVRFLLHFDTSVPALIAAGIVVTVLSLLALANLQYEPANGPLSLAWLRGLFDDPDTYLSTHWPGIWGVIVLTGGWFRGVTVAQRDLTYQRALTSYTAGLLVVVALLLVEQGSTASDVINAAALPYFMLGLLSLSLVHLSKAEYQQGDFLRSPWLLTLSGTVGVLALLSALVGLFPLAMLNRLLAPVGTVFLRVLDLIILAIAYPIGLFVTWLLRRITGGRAIEWPIPNRAVSDGARQLQEQANKGGPPALIVFLGKTIFVLVLAAIVGYVLWRFFRWLRRPLRDEPGDETREAIGEGGLGADLGALMGAMLGRFRRPPGVREPALPPDILAVRRLYLRALRRAADRGTPRPDAATPHEFAPDLVRSLETPTAETLSVRFAAARYGLVAPPRTDLAELEREAG